MFFVKQRSNSKKESGVVDQKTVFIGAMIFIVLTLFIAVLIFGAGYGMIKKYADVGCHVKEVLKVFLSQGQKQTVDSICAAFGGGDSGGAGASGSFDCYDGELDIKALTDQLKADEGVKLCPYQDSSSNKYWTIGVGHNLESGNKPVAGSPPSEYIGNQTKCITEQQATDLLSSDLDSAIKGTKDAISFFDRLPGTARQILVEMYFQMGERGLKEHQGVINALGNQQWSEAGAQIIDSARYTQLVCDKETEPTSPAAIAERKSAAQKFRDGLPVSSKSTLCRVIKQADRMNSLTGTGVCKIPKLTANDNNSCRFEKPGALEIGQYDSADNRSTGHFPIYESAANALGLVKIDSREVNTGNQEKYINLQVYEALKRAANSSACNKNCFTVTSAYRSCEHQKELKKQNSGAADPGESNHNGGTGVDINGSGEFECNSERCSVKLVEILERQKLIHYKGCSTKSGGYYVPSEEYKDCVHFSPDGK